LTQNRILKFEPGPKSKDELNSIINSLKSQGKKIVFTNGVFDIVHRGHVEYLNEAKSLGDVLIVGLNSDSSVKRIKGEDRPVNSENDRAFVLVNLKAVDYIIIFEEDTPQNLIKAVIPDVLVKGGDWEPADIVGSDIVLDSGGEVLSLKYVNGYSTTEIIKKSKKLN
jgi:rfaE bifunctional protein nucleotidyltransferase chain/domain